MYNRCDYFDMGQKYSRVFLTKVNKYSIFVMMENRYLFEQINADLKKKMVFLGGPRQVGKTTLAKKLLGKQKGYLNWDIPDDRERILKRELYNSDFWVFDELHKYKKWRNYLKGLYDAKDKDQKILVTGSARMDFYKFGGDSLQGRYHYLRLFPLSVAELEIQNQKDLLELLTLGGFPEPFFSSSVTQAKRWSKEYRQRIIDEDLTSLERITDLGNMHLLLLRLPDLTGAPLSINALREDIQVSHKTVSNWLNILERLYAIFRLAPFGSPKIRAVKKEQKHYHFDWTVINNESIRFENMVALHLLKWVSYLEDTQGTDIELRYFRDIDGREVDFILVENKEPVMIVECKWSDTEISKGLKYFKTRFPNTQAWQVSAVGKKDYISPDKIRVCNVIELLKTLI